MTVKWRGDFDDCQMKGKLLCLPSERGTETAKWKGSFDAGQVKGNL